MQKKFILIIMVIALIQMKMVIADDPNHVVYRHFANCGLSGDCNNARNFYYYWMSNTWVAAEIGGIMTCFVHSTPITQSNRGDTRLAFDTEDGRAIWLETTTGLITIDTRGVESINYYVNYNEDNVCDYMSSIPNSNFIQEVDVSGNIYRGFEICEGNIPCNYGAADCLSLRSTAGQEMTDWIANPTSANLAIAQSAIVDWASQC